MYLVSVLFVAVTSIGLVAARARFPAGLATWSACLILLLPMTGLVQTGYQEFADRYTYLAGLPLAFLVGAGVDRLLARAARPWTLAGLIALGVAALDRCAPHRE